VAELWFYPDGPRILELSTKCLPGEGFQVAAETKAFLAARGVDLAGRLRESDTVRVIDSRAGRPLRRQDGSRHAGRAATQIRPIRSLRPDQEAEERSSGT
jgi:hypothetical protein